MVDQTDKIGIRDEKESFRGAAPLANKFRIHDTGSNIRLSFMEGSADGELVEFRAAVSLSHSDFLDLVTILTAAAGNLEKQRHPSRSMFPGGAEPPFGRRQNPLG